MTETGSAAGVVVGGASGIGAAVAARYRQAGRDVVVWDVQGDADVTCDVADEAQVDAALAATIARLPDLPTELTATPGTDNSGLRPQNNPGV